MSYAKQTRAAEIRLYVALGCVEPFGLDCDMSNQFVTNTRPRLLILAEVLGVLEEAYGA